MLNDQAVIYATSGRTINAVNVGRNREMHRNLAKS